MRVSTYEVILPLIGSGERLIEGKRLLVNGLYASVDVVDEETAARLVDGNVDALPIALRERLASRGHVTRKDPEQETKDVSLLGHIYDRTFAYSGLSLVVLPTHDCNFRCPYCFEKHRLARGQEWLSRRMSPEVVEAMFAALQKQRDKGYQVTSCVLYGGEPLMRENKTVVRDICEHARQMGLKLEAITNGYDLEEYLDLLEEYEFVRLQVTVDGVGALNDCRRRHRDGIPTYDKIMENVRLALERGIDIQLRVNVNRENIDGISDLIHDISARGLVPSEQDKCTDSEGSPECGRFSYYFKAVSEDLDSPTRVSEQEVMDAIVAAGVEPYDALKLQSQYSIALNNLSDMMAEGRYPLAKVSYCGAISGGLIVGPTGQLHTCWDLVGMDEESVGFTDMASGRFAYNFSKAKWRLRTSDRLERCLTCPYVFLCRGGCAVEAKRTTGSYFQEHCGEFAEIFAYAVSREIGRRWEESEEDELSISLYGPLSRMTPEEREELTVTTSGKRIVELLRQVGMVPAKKDRPA